MEYRGLTLVTGAAGFMGRHVVKHLAGLGVKIRATARPKKDTSFFDRLGVEFVPADLTKPETLPPLFEGKVDRVFHLGAICNFSTSYENLRPTNVLGVEHITRLALTAGVRCYVHVGSTSVYGPYRGKPFSEDAPREPQDNYGRSKRDGEDVVRRRMAEGLPAIITRPCTVYGPGCNDGAGKVFSRPSKIAAIPGNGRQRLSNIRAEDVAVAVEYLSRQKDAFGKTFNLADNSHPTVGEALTLAAKAFGQKPPKLHLPLALIRALARLDGLLAARRGKIPDLESDAVAYLDRDYLVDNAALLATGYQLLYPDFVASLRQLGQWYQEHGADL